MNIFEFLNRLETTLEKIKVSGKEDTNRMYATFVAIDELRESLKNEMHKALKDGEDDGGQTNIGTESCGENTSD